MNTIEANIIRSFAEVRKEISNLQDQVKELKQSIPKTKSHSKIKTKSKKPKRK